MNGVIVAVALPPTPPAKPLMMSAPISSVLVPTTASVAAGSKLTTVPDTVIILPGSKVWVPTMNSEFEPAV